MISLILATIRLRSDISLALPSSGIAATSLEGSRTAHSALKLPLNLQVDEDPTCNLRFLKYCSNVRLSSGTSGSQTRIGSPESHVERFTK